MESVLLFIVGVLVVVAGLALSIGLHEVGHLVPAKKFGVRVGQYMIGFGPTLFSKRVGETEYGVKAIPLGGYISMSGMFPPAKPGGKPRSASTGFFDTLVQDARDVSKDTVADGEEHRTFYNLPVLKRIVIMLGGPIMNLVLAVVFYAILLCGIGLQGPSMTVQSVSECIIATTEERTQCTADDPLTPANEAGIEPGDTIIAVNDEAVTEWTRMQAIIRERAGEATPIVIERDGRRLTLELTPGTNHIPVVDERGRVVENDGVVQTREVGFIGVSSLYERERSSPAAVLPAVGENIAMVGNLIINLPQRMVGVVQAAFGTQERDLNGPISVVGVGRIAGEVASHDGIPVLDRVATLVGLLANLNVALFVFNLIPLMPLDGGHILGAVLEWLRKGWARLRHKPDPGPIDTAKWVPLTLAVTAVLGVMSVILIVADIVRPVNIFG